GTLLPQPAAGHVDGRLHVELVVPDGELPPGHALRVAEQPGGLVVERVLATVERPDVDRDPELAALGPEGPAGRGNAHDRAPGAGKGPKPRLRRRAENRPVPRARPPGADSPFGHPALILVPLFTSGAGQAGGPPRGGVAADFIRFPGGSGAMRKTFLAAGLVVLAAACGGEKPAEEPAAMTPEQPAAEAPAAATTGTTHDVNMVLEGTAYKYVPAELTIKA